MDIDTAFPSKYLKASDLGQSEAIVTISHIKTEEVGQKREQRPVLYFRGKDKGLVLNKTNARKIAEILGNKDTDTWTDKRIRLYATETTYQTDVVACIRVKSAGGRTAAPAPATAPPPPEPPADEPDGFMDEEIPF